MPTRSHDHREHRPTWPGIARWIRDNGWRYSPARLLELWADRSFDRRHGTETSRFAELRTLAIASPNKRQGERYQPSPVRSLRQLLRKLDIDVASRSFIDLGCGKGRTLLLAAELPFKQVIGIDFSAELVACAERNVDRFRGRKPRADIAVVLCDATQYELPPGDLVLYFFKPFTDEILARVTARIAESLRAQPRKVTIVYLYLDTPALLEAAGFRWRWSWRKFRVYEFLSEGRIEG